MFAQRTRCPPTFSTVMWSEKDDRLPALLSLLQSFAPKAAIIFVNDQSEKAKRAGNTPSAVTVAEYLSRNKVTLDGDVLWEPLVLEEVSHMNARAATLSAVTNVIGSMDITGRQRKNIIDKMSALCILGPLSSMRVAWTVFRGLRMVLMGLLLNNREAGC